MDRYIDIVARLFSLALDFNMNPDALIERIMRIDIIRDIERKYYFELDNKNFRSIAGHVFPELIIQDDYLFRYDRGYWCGYIYMNLFLELKKPISYLMLKLPLRELMAMYDVYHEMDISQLVDYFLENENENTIIEILLKRNSISIAKLSRISGVPLRTIKYLKESDMNLYKGSFKNIHRIALALDVPDNLFLNEIN